MVKSEVLDIEMDEKYKCHWCGSTNIKSDTWEIRCGDCGKQI